MSGILYNGLTSANTVDLINAMTPAIAVISMGKWNDGQGTSNKFNTWHYGHPRKFTVDILSLGIQGQRSTPITVQVGVESQKFQEYRVRKWIYGTGWDGTVKIRATSAGSFIVTRMSD